MTVKNEQGNLFDPDPILPIFDRFEQPVIDKLTKYLLVQRNDPLLTIDEKDIELDDPERYLERVSAVPHPKDSLAEIQEGKTTRQEIARKGRARKAITRIKKDEMFVDRIITATYAADTCRSLYRLAATGVFIPIEHDDTPETTKNRVGDYITDMFRAGRETRLLNGAAMLRTTDKIKSKFESSSEADFVLSSLAGMNSMKKIQHWIDMLYKTSKGFDLKRIDDDSIRRLSFYAVSRPVEYDSKFDLLKAIADTKIRNETV